MGGCASVKQNEVMQEVVILKNEYSEMVKEIKKNRNLLFKKFPLNPQEALAREEDFSFFQDIKLLLDDQGDSNKECQLKNQIYSLKLIESRFRQIQNVLNILLRIHPSLQRDSEIHPKFKNIIQEAFSLRFILYDYFYSDIEFSDVPNELI